jgi:alkanesulfonate monooxygenase SsuD/methylene tetrahydromethanopterin reductase-like flavin-dependent oxidoreductase (luciferase family)
MSGPWFGIYLPQLRMSFDRIVERTHAAEAAGFDSVWLMDHFAAPAAPEIDTFEGWTVATALAARTSTIRFGHLVLCDPFRHPVLLAKMAATLDVISNGRLELGIGWGSVPAELQTYGFGPERPAVRAAKLRETLEILDLMFGGETFDYDGEHFKLERAIGRPVPAQAHVPVHIGGGGPKLTMPLVERFADWWNCPGYALDRIDDLRPLAGRARISTQHPIGLARDASTRDDVIATAHRRFGTWGGVIGGTAEEVARELAAEVKRGVEGFVLQFSDFGTPETIEHFMTEVAPVVREESRSGTAAPAARDEGESDHRNEDDQPRRR